jgi:hypothetical protein
MTDIEFLTLVQQQTDTKAVVVDEYYKSAFMDWAILDHNAPKHIISRKFDELIDEFIRIEMLTPYESMVHYPFVKRLLDELCFTCKEIGLFDDTFQKPLIGTANLTKINAYAKSDYNTIIIDRNLMYFISNIARVVVGLIVTNEESDCYVKPSILTMDELKRRILADINIVRDFMEIMYSYIKYGTVFPYSQFHKLGNVDIGQYHQSMVYEADRFIIAHELMHLFYKHKQSNPAYENQADFMATQICGKSVEMRCPETQFYWVPVFVTATLDLLRKYGQSIGLDVSTHPDDRAGLAHYTIQQMKAGGYALGMAEAIRGIMIMLWDITHKQVIELSKDPMITDIDTLRRVVSLIDFKGNYNFY